MIFLFGTRGTSQKTIEIHQPCPGCKSNDSIFLVVAQRYFHIFWIPIFPTSKENFFICDSCGGSFPANNFVIDQQIKSKIKTPKWTFFGLFFGGIAILGLLVLGITSTMENKKNYNSYIKDPKNGDVYEIKLAPKQYSLLKVVSFTGDSIFFYPHSEYTNKSSGLKKMSNEYLDIEEGYSKEELTKLVDSRDILKIKR